MRLVHSGGPEPKSSKLALVITLSDSVDLMERADWTDDYLGCRSEGGRLMINGNTAGFAVARPAPPITEGDRFDAGLLHRRGSPVGVPASLTSVGVGSLGVGIRLHGRSTSVQDRHLHGEPRKPAAGSMGRLATEVPSGGHAKSLPATRPPYRTGGFECAVTS